MAKTTTKAAPAATTFGSRLKKLRESIQIQRLGLTPAELAAMTGLSVQTIYRLEAGQNTPTSDVVLKLADALKCTTDELLGREPPKKKSVSG